MSARATKMPGRLGIVGHPVAHSLSPVFQNAALKAAAIPLRYERFDTLPDELESRIAMLRANDAAGNVTIPHKESVALLCDGLTETARRAGAVNTFWCEGGRLWGDNTDVVGFDAAATVLVGGHTPGLQAAVIGAGGAAAAVLVALANWPGATVKLHNRSAPRARELATRLQRVAPLTIEIADSLAECVRSAALVVNATSVGLRDDEMPVPPDCLPTDAAVLDLVYRPGETAWVRAARARGHRAADGIGMLLEQGIAAFERWFGTSPDRAAMRRALDAATRR